MCLSSEAIDELHAITSAIKDVQDSRDAWLALYQSRVTHDGQTFSLDVTHGEATRIYADRIAAHETKLKDLGWSRIVRVESAAPAQDSK